MGKGLKENIIKDAIFQGKEIQTCILQLDELDLIHLI